MSCPQLIMIKANKVVAAPSSPYTYVCIYMSRISRYPNYLVYLYLLHKFPNFEKNNEQNNPFFRENCTILTPLCFLLLSAIKKVWELGALCYVMPSCLILFLCKFDWQLSMTRGQKNGRRMIKNTNKQQQQWLQSMNWV